MLIIACFFFVAGRPTDMKVNALSISDQTGGSQCVNPKSQWIVKKVVSNRCTIDGAVKIVHANMTEHIKLVVLHCLHHELIEFYDVYKYAKTTGIKEVAVKLFREIKKLKASYPGLEVVSIIPAAYNFVEYNYNAYTVNYGTEMSDDWHTYVAEAHKFGHSYARALHYIVTVLQKLDFKYHCLLSTTHSYFQVSATSESTAVSLLGYSRKVVLVGDDQIDAIKFNNVEMHDIYKRVVPGAHLEQVIRIVDSIMKKTFLVAKRTKLVVVMPFLHSIINNGNECDKKQIQEYVKIICGKTKIWKAKLPDLKILWVLPHSVDFDKYRRTLPDGESLNVEELEKSFSKSYERLRDSMELSPIATLSPDYLFDVSLSDDGLTLSKSCCDVLMKRISKLFKRLDTDFTCNGGYKVVI